MSEKELARAAWRMVEDADAEELAKLSVSEIARRLMVNRSTLSRAFSAYYSHFTLREFLEMKKLSKFDMLLWFNKAKTVKEALEILDIRDRSHFIKRGSATPTHSRSARCCSFGVSSQKFAEKTKFHKVLLKDTRLPA